MNNLWWFWLHADQVGRVVKNKKNGIIYELIQFLESITISVAQHSLKLINPTALGQKCTCN